MLLPRIETSPAPVYKWEIILQAGFYVTPILYSMSVIVNVDYQKILLLNPMAQAIQDARYALVTHQTTTISSLFGEGLIRFLPIGICATTLIIGVWYFKREAKDFAENL